jgi:hypothetical protein
MLRQNTEKGEALKVWGAPAPSRAGNCVLAIANFTGFEHYLL